jgi:hypothetical protein
MHTKSDANEGGTYVMDLPALANIREKDESK